MSFTDALGAAWDKVKQIGAPLGTAFEAAVATDEGQALLHSQYSPVQVVGKPIGKALSALDWAVSKGFSQPMSAIYQMAGTGDFSASSAATAYTRAPGISPGEAFAIGVTPDSALAGRSINPADPYAEASKAARFDYYRNTWSGRLQSGSVDLALNLFADPAAFALGGASKLSKAQRALRPGEAAPVMSLVREGSAASGIKRVDKMASQVDGFLNWSVGKTAAEIAEHPAMQRSTERGTLSYLLSRSTSREESADIFGTMLGDTKSIDNLAQRNAVLAEELKTLQKPPVPSVAADKFTWDDAGQGAFDFYNTEVTRDVLARQKEVNGEIDRLNRILDAQGTQNVVGASKLQEVGLSYRLSGIRVGTILDGLGDRGAQVVAGKLGNRLDGHVSLADPVAGYDQLQNTLNQARRMTGIERRQFLDEYARAANRGDRQDVVRRAEGAVVRSIAAHYKLSPKAADTYLNMALARRGVMWRAMESRVYSMAPESRFASLVDPDSGITSIYEVPVLQSQIENFHPLIDPKYVEDVLKSSSNQRWLEKAAFYFGDKFGPEAGAGARGVASSAYEVTDPIRESTSTAMQWMTSGWKDAVLLPRAPAYAVRIQVDSQMRLMAKMGAMAYIGSLPTTVRNWMLYNFTKPGALKPGDIEGSVRQALKFAGLPASEIDGTAASLVAKHGAHAGLLDEMSDSFLETWRGSGQWVSIAPSDANWAKHWNRAVNRQVRNSPTAMAYIKGADADMLKVMVRDNPQMRAEWSELAGSYEGDLDRWLARIQDHVDHLLPTPEMRVAAMKGRVNAEKFFSGENSAMAMQVHGESMTPFVRNPAAEMYGKVRNNLYALVAEAPETMLARVPLFTHEYNVNLKRIFANLGGEDALSAEQVLSAQRQAARIARRNVAQTLFDSSHTSNLAHTFKLASPFFAAWEDMMKKWSGLIYDNPQVFERLRQGAQTPNDMGLVRDEYGNIVDEHGQHIDPNTGEAQTEPALTGEQEFVTVPLKWLPKSWTEKLGADALTFNKKSLNVVFQGEPWWLPGYGPLAQIPANEIAIRAFPESADNPVMRHLLPFGLNEEGPVVQALPTWARQLRNANPNLFGTSSEWREVAGRVMKDETVKFQRGDRDTAPTMDEVAQITGNWFKLRVMTSLTAPVAVRPQAELQFFVDQAHVYRQKFGAVQDSPQYQADLEAYRAKFGSSTAKARLLADKPEYEDWQTRFYHDFPEYFSLSVSTSVSETGIAMTNNAVSAAQKWGKVIADSPEWGWAIIGPDNAYGLTEGTEYSSNARAWQLRTEATPGGATFRSGQDPKEALERAEVDRGWKQYMQDRTALNIILEDAGITLGSKAAESVKLVWDARVEQLKKDNQAWARDFGTQDSGKAVDFMRSMVSATKRSDSLAGRGDMQVFQQYLRDRQAVREVLAEVGVKTINAASVALLKDAWDQRVAGLAAQSPGFEQMYNRVLQFDDLSGTVDY